MEGFEPPSAFAHRLSRGSQESRSRRLTTRLHLRGKGIMEDYMGVKLTIIKQFLLLVKKWLDIIIWDYYTKKIIAILRSRYIYIQF